MLRLVSAFEVVINAVLLCLIAALVVLSTGDLGALIVRSVTFSPLPLVDIQGSS